MASTAIELPDDLFAFAEEAARRSGHADVLIYIENITMCDRDRSESREVVADGPAEAAPRPPRSSRWRGIGAMMAAIALIALGLGVLAMNRKSARFRKAAEGHELRASTLTSSAWLARILDRGAARQLPPFGLGGLTPKIRELALSRLDADRETSWAERDRWAADHPWASPPEEPPPPSHEEYRTACIAAAIEYFTGSDRLGFSGFDVRDDDLDPLRGQAGLKSLDLSNNSITDAGLDRILPLKKLEVLILDQNALTAAGLERLKAMPHLRQVSLGHLNLTEDEVFGLATALPRTVLLTDYGRIPPGTRHPN